MLTKRTRHPRYSVRPTVSVSSAREIKPAHNHTLGFTLIEILVVIVIIGLMSAAMVMVSGDNRREVILDETERALATMHLAMEEAQLYGVEMGMAFTETNYRFVNFDNDRWKAIPNDLAYKVHQLPEGYEFYLEIEGFPSTDGKIPGAKINEKGQVEALKKDDDSGTKKSAKSSTKNTDSKESNAAENGDRPSDVEEPESLLPQIFVLSSGEFNPFVLAIGSRQEPGIFYRLRGNAEGDIKVEGPLQGDMVNDLNMPWEDPRALDHEE